MGAHSDGVRGVDLVVRTATTVGNYDYVFEARLRQDASIELRCTAAGYMSALFYDPAGATVANLPFGTRVHT